MALAKLMQHHAQKEQHVPVKSRAQKVQKSLETADNKHFNDDSGDFGMSPSPRAGPTPLNFSALKDQAAKGVSQHNSGSKTHEMNPQSQGFGFGAAAEQENQLSKSGNANDGEKTVRQFSAISPMCQHESIKKPTV